MGVGITIEAPDIASKFDNENVENFIRSNFFDKVNDKEK